MKVLLIAEDDKTIDALVPVIKKSGAEIITYRWLLKALDNVEEIAPDMVVISTAEYPRHWKTFVQFTKSGIGGVVPKVILYNSRPMSDDEKSKARSLGVFGMFNSLDEKGLEEVEKYLAGKSEQAFGFVSNGPKFELVFTNPKNESLITGSVKSVQDNRIEFTSDIPDLIKNLNPGDSIANATFGENKAYRYVSAKVLSNGKFLELKLT